MELARETLINAQGWSDLDVADNTETSQLHLDFAHKVATTFKTSEGKEVLKAMVEKYMLCNIANDTDTSIAIGRRQGRADVVKYILQQIELSNNS